MGNPIYVLNLSLSFAILCAISILISEIIAKRYDFDNNKLAIFQILLLFSLPISFLIMLNHCISTFKTCYNMYNSNPTTIVLIIALVIVIKVMKTIVNNNLKSSNYLVMKENF